MFAIRLLPRIKTVADTFVLSTDKSDGGSDLILTASHRSPLAALFCSQPMKVITDPWNGPAIGGSRFDVVRQNHVVSDEVGAKVGYI